MQTGLPRKIAAVPFWSIGKSGRRRMIPASRHT
ncbi:MAG: hypothetical protein JWO62_430 [Acidimicrobiaceae bacterium]|nr:hypothetical protein [Acidimicrobiaceae bacterium]